MILGGLGVGLDREWLVGLALVPLFLGILLPRLTGSIEVGPSGVKGQLISPDEVRALVRVEAEAAGLPEDEIERVVEKVDEVVPQAVELRLSPARARANASLDLRVIGRSLGGTIADGIVSDYGRDARLDLARADRSAARSMYRLRKARSPLQPERSLPAVRGSRPKPRIRAPRLRLRAPFSWLRRGPG